MISLEKVEEILRRIVLVEPCLNALEKVKHRVDEDGRHVFRFLFLVRSHESLGRFGAAAPEGQRGFIKSMVTTVLWPKGWETRSIEMSFSEEAPDPEAQLFHLLSGVLWSVIWGVGRWSAPKIEAPQGTGVSWRAIETEALPLE